MQKETDWFQLLFKHTDRQANIANVQILVSLFVLGFVWRDETPLVAVVVMVVVYFFCAAYLISSLYKIQDRRITLYKYITITEPGQLPDGNKPSRKLIDCIKEFPKHFIDYIKEFPKHFSDNQVAKESDEKKLRENYIKKLRPAPKILVLIQHIIVSSFALMLIFGSAGYKIDKLLFKALLELDNVHITINQTVILQLNI